MSIFSKICPRCAGDNKVDVTHCQCGFVFEASATTGSYRALEMAEQEAQVYAEYLQARVQQSKSSAEVAIADQARFPDDDAKTATAKSANAEYIEAKVEYDEQMKLVLEIRAETAKSQAVEHKKQASAWEEAKTRAKEKAIQAEKDAIVAALEEKKEIARKLKIQKQAKIALAKQEEIIKQKKLKAKAARAAIAKMAGQKTPPPKMQAKMANQAEAAAARVRQAQSSIKKEMEAAAAALSTITSPESVTNRPTAPEANKEITNGSPVKVAPVLAKKIIKSNPDEKECPNCTAAVRVKTKECKCGYVFPEGNEQMDGIGLSEEDSAKLLNLFQPHT